MSQRKTAAQHNQGGANGFPSEVAQVFGEVSRGRLDELRKESDAMIKQNDLELLDGFDFPYPKRA